MIASSLVARLTASIQRPPLGMPSVLTAVWRTANRAPTQDGTVRGSKIARAHSSGVCPAAFSVAIVVVAAARPPAGRHQGLVLLAFLLARRTAEGRARALGDG